MSLATTSVQTRKPADGGHRGEARRHVLGALAEVTERPQGEEDRAVEGEEEAGNSGEDGVHAEQVAEVAGEGLVGGDRDAVEQARERDAPEERHHERRDRVQPRPDRLPARRLRLATPLERQHADDEEGEDQEEGEVEAREHRRVPDREGRERRGPAITSQTSLPSQTGPIVANIVLRSLSLLPRTGGACRRRSRSPRARSSPSRRTRAGRTRGSRASSQYAGAGSAPSSSPAPDRGRVAARTVA